MKIIFRNSRGRGEYEISGSCDGYVTADAINKRITVVLASDWRVETGLIARRESGKPRLRSIVKGQEMGIQRQVCAALLLNPTVRSRSGVESGGQLLDFIEARHVEIIGDELIFHAATIQVSDSAAKATINVIKRVEEVKDIWRRVGELPHHISESVRKQHEEVTSGGPISRATERICHELPDLLHDADQEAEELVAGAGDLLPGLQSLTNAPVTRPIFDVEEIPVQEVELKRRAIVAWRKWQLTNTRGNSGKVFREGVRAAYNSTCLICGIRLPPTDANISGVDAAHILPWRDYEADDIYNGICLCKNHHWAFDSRLLVITADEHSNDYRVEIPQRARDLLLARGETEMVSWLESCVGVIPEERLPQNPLQWPKRQFLNTLAMLQEQE